MQYSQQVAGLAWCHIFLPPSPLPARTCEVMETQPHDSDETLFIHNLQSLADYVRSAQVLFNLWLPSKSVVLLYSQYLTFLSYYNWFGTWYQQRQSTSPSFLLQLLLVRVEEAVDKFLYWDEEVSIIEAVTSVSRLWLLTLFLLYFPMFLLPMFLLTPSLVHSCPGLPSKFI